MMTMLMLMVVRSSLSSAPLFPINFPRQVFFTVREHIDLGSGNARPYHSVNFYMRVNFQSGDSLFEELGWNASVDKRSEKHVAADSRRAIEVSNSHRSTEPSRDSSRLDCPLSGKTIEG